MKIELSEMPGVEKPVMASRFHDIDEALQLIQTERAITEAHQNGSITVYRDDNGILRAEFHIYRSMVSRFEGSVEALRDWLECWIPIMRGIAPQRATD
jgi:hypothetical protein